MENNDMSDLIETLNHYGISMMPPRYVYDRPSIDIGHKMSPPSVWPPNRKKFQERIGLELRGSTPRKLHIIRQIIRQIIHQ